MNDRAGGAARSITAARRIPTQGGGNRGWWPDRLNLKILAKNPAVANPLGEDFDYRAAFNALDLAAVKQDIDEVHDRPRRTGGRPTSATTARS